MTVRERYLETLLFGKPDKIPFSPGWPREKTLKRWREEGLPPDGDWFDYLCRTIGIEHERPASQVTSPNVDFRMIPMFEEKVLEHRDGHYIVQDWMGNIVEISDEYDYTYLRDAKDFVTRKWHKFPVETREDFAAMKRRYDPAAAGRYPTDFAERVGVMKERDYVASLGFHGPFWQLREWCGFEPLCLLFLEDPDFVHEMIEFWTEFVSRTMARALETGVIDSVFISEDMAFKGKPMIGPDATREFLLPAWSRWVAEARAERYHQFKGAHDTDDDAAAAAVEGAAVLVFRVRGVAGVAQGIAGGDEGEELGGVGGLDVVGRDAEFDGIEVDGVEEAAAPGIGHVGGRGILVKIVFRFPMGRRNCGDGVDSFPDVRPVGLQVPGLGKGAGDADDGEGCGRGRLFF